MLYMSRQCFWRHKKTIHKDKICDKEKETLLEENEKLKKELEELKKKNALQNIDQKINGDNNNTNIINGNNNTTTNIILSFGKEDLSLLSQDEIKQVLNSGRSLILIYFLLKN